MSETAKYTERKRTRLPLRMENGVEVRTLEELRDNFSIKSMCEYLETGQLLTWLRDRYYDDIADEIETLDAYDDNDGRLYAIFGVDNPEIVEIKREKEKRAAEKLKKLKNVMDETECKRYMNVIDEIAFTQDDVYDLLDEGQSRIYLCGEQFEVPISARDVTYIGIGEPLVLLRVKEKMNLEEERGIRFENVKFGTTKARDAGMRFKIGVTGVIEDPDSFVRKNYLEKTRNAEFELMQFFEELGYDRDLDWFFLNHGMRNTTNMQENFELIEVIYELGCPEHAEKYRKFLREKGHEVAILYNACFG